MWEILLNRTYKINDTRNTQIAFQIYIKLLELFDSNVTQL